LPPSELYNLAMGDIAAEEIADARNRSTLRFARAIAQERAVGEATGRLPFEAQLAEQRRAGTEVGKSKGAAAIAAAAGGPGAVNLGVNPSKEVLKSFAARPGWTQTTGPGGEVIMIPPPPTPEQVEKAPAGVDQNVWNAMTPQDRANFVQLTERPAGVPATVSLVEPRAIGAFNVAMENLKELTSPDVVNAFPGECGDGAAVGAEPQSAARDAGILWQRARRRDRHDEDARRAARRHSAAFAHAAAVRGTYSANGSYYQSLRSHTAARDRARPYARNRVPSPGRRGAGSCQPRGAAVARSRSAWRVQLGPASGGPASGGPTGFASPAALG